MKNVRTIILAILVLLSNACENFLDTEPIVLKTETNYYTSPAEAVEALTGCYDALQLIWSDGVALPVAAEIMADQCFAGAGAQDQENYPMIDEFDKTRAPAHSNQFEPNWTNYYVGIYRCNLLISKIDQVLWEDQESLRATIEGEARFLRAFFYFDMVRMFERIPLLTEPSSENLPQAEPDETYKVITEDLLFAIENCDAVPYGEIPQAEYGHANKWAAQSLLARVFLYYTGYYGKTDLLGLVSKDEVLGYVENVISDGGFGLVENFSDLWPAAATYEAAKNGHPIAEATYAGETNKEVVFSIKYTYTSDYDGNVDGNHWMVVNGLRGSSWAEYGYGNGWGACTVLPSVYANWDEQDKRRSASILSIADEGITYDTKDQKEYTGYFTKKYIPTCDENGNSIADDIYDGENFMIAQFQDYYAIRYADVLLMAAELGSSNAMDYVNLVRGRAGVDAVDAVTRDVIFEERRLEFAFEGLRYWDLLRYDYTLAYAADKISFSGTVENAKIVVPKVITGSNLVLTRGLCQIPTNQITLSDGVLVQNPGW